MLQQCLSEYADLAQFLLIYIAESHAVDEWPVGETIIKKQHRTLPERIVACQECLEDFQLNMPTVVDSVENEFHHTYACWPIRFYMINNGVFEVVARPKQFGYDLQDIADWLAQLKSKVQA